MDKEMKEKVKKVLWKMIQIPTIVCVLIVSGAICYYAKVFYRTNTLAFGIQDTKMLLGISVAAIWSTWFCMGLMFTLNKKNDFIIDQNEMIKDLLHQVKDQSNMLLEKSNEIKEQNDYIVDQADENYDNLVKFQKNSRQIFMDRGDNIA